jgi:hypothetical protein
MFAQHSLSSPMHQDLAKIIIKLYLLAMKKNTQKTTHMPAIWCPQRTSQIFMQINFG